MEGLIRLERRIGKRLEIRKVKGHSKNPHNKAVDKLARSSAQTAVNPGLSPAKLRRKKSPKRLVAGSIQMEGQVMWIHVHKAEHMRVQRLNAYRYSVESTDSPYFEEIGWLFAEREVNLSAGHSYEVRVNGDTKNPRIDEVIRELPPGSADASIAST